MSDELDDKQGGDDKDPLADIKDVMKGLPDNIQKSIHEGLQSAITQAQRDAADDEPDDDDEPEPDISDDDLERMSRKEFGNAIAGRVVKAIEGRLKEFDKQMEGLSVSGQKTAIKQAIDETVKSNPDFWEFKNEMGAVAKQYPSLDPQSIYELAKAKNPQKVKELEDKKKVEEDEKATKERPNRRFGGLTPTSGSEKTKKEKMGRKEAAESAWDEAMSDLPPELIGTGN